MKHSPAFERLVEDARSHIEEISIEAYCARIDAGEPLVLVDVREESEWARERIRDAVYLGRGVFERDLESRFPDVKTPLVLYCGGGFRSALAALNAKKMGYENVTSLIGGIRGWREMNLSTDVRPLVDPHA